jgi:hypothetical protein
MLTFSKLGNYGHLGNQMFQFAALRGIADNRGFDWAIPSQELFGTNYPLRSSIYECFELKSLEGRTSSSNQNAISEKSFEFDEDLYNNCPDDSDLEGYFQSQKYFKNIESSIKEDFTFKQSIMDRAQDLIKNFNQGKTVSVHIRRTDYVGNDYHHFNLPVGYYSNLIDELGECDLIIICSDDIEWCANQPELINKKNVFFSTENSYVDLALISLCKINIMANSSFSWWGSWLNTNPDRMVFTPKTWFGEAYKNFSLEDLLLTEWVVINN